MAALPFNRCEFISAEINHDFYLPKNPKTGFPGFRLNEYQPGIWDCDTMCTGDWINSHGGLPKARSAGADGDNDLVGQMFKRLDGTPYTKQDLKNLLGGTPHLNGGGLCTNRSFPIQVNVTKNVNITESNPPPLPDAKRNELFQPDLVPITMNITFVPETSTDFNVLKVFEYPDENFLIIDAASEFVTGILKEAAFPSSERPVVDNLVSRLRAETGNFGAKSPAATAKLLGYALTTEELFTTAEFTAINAAGIPDATLSTWPFRPKINIINTPTTFADPSSNIDQSNYNINAKLPPDVLVDNDNNIPGLSTSAQNACPIIFSWYYNQPEISEANSALMMSRYKIKTELAVTAGAGGVLVAPSSYKMKQVWQIGAGGTGPDFTLSNANEQNNISNLKNIMIGKPGAIMPIDEAAPTKITEPRGWFQKSPIAPGDKCKASKLVQRKRSGDYLQIKSAYEFPVKAALHGDNISYFNLIVGPTNAKAATATTTLKGEGNLKASLIPDGVKPEAQMTRNKQWFRNRTYYVTGDWPAFCYASYNKVNCIFVCRSGGCLAGIDVPKGTILFRNYFGNL
jgi:hypothetical protein